ncbi:MAG: Fur family transcriptional regulator [Candidatus Eisenbacteria bacterium]
MEPAHPYRSQLRQAEIKVTRIRLALLDTLARESRHMTADEITAALRTRAVRADRVTVYRNIDRMIESGMLVATHLPGRAMRVGLCTQPDSPHHHHIVCERCGRVAETSGCPVLDAQERLAKEIRGSCGFQLTSHITQYVGICPACQAAPGGESAG